MADPHDDYIRIPVDSELRNRGLSQRARAAQGPGAASDVHSTTHNPAYESYPVPAAWNPGWTNAAVYQQAPAPNQTAWTDNTTRHFYSDAQQHQVKSPWIPQPRGNFYQTAGDVTPYAYPGTYPVPGYENFPPEPLAIAHPVSSPNQSGLPSHRHLPSSQYNLPSYPAFTDFNQPDHPPAIAQPAAGLEPPQVHGGRAKGHRQQAPHRRRPSSKANANISPRTGSSRSSLVSSPLSATSPRSSLHRPPPRAIMPAPPSSRASVQSRGPVAPGPLFRTRKIRTSSSTPIHAQGEGSTTAVAQHSSKSIGVPSISSEEWKYKTLHAELQGLDAEIARIQKLQSRQIPTKHQLSKLKLERAECAAQLAKAKKAWDAAAESK
ncbi:uncharacterized protein JCM15063_006095 [Sporobolomyces koalae]|uniref:uncharacterized protein n=1 Tax=Sporobolomyces koalae TaxID=500713 RepID=UPI00317ACFEF